MEDEPAIRDNMEGGEDGMRNKLGSRLVAKGGH
jgi:hypothetical protein